MNGAEAAFLQQLLHGTANSIGQVAITREGDGGFTLTHRDDLGRDDLQVCETASDVASHDDAGNYRPLKTAPNLRHGWKLRATCPAALARVIDRIYPGRLAALRAFEAGQLRTTALRDTLARQSGMYRVAAQISDDQLDRLVGNFCQSDGGCLRTILWKRDLAGTVASTALPTEKFDPAQDQVSLGSPRAGTKAIPLLCQEGCNLLVAAARRVVRAEP